MEAKTKKRLWFAGGLTALLAIAAVVTGMGILQRAPAAVMTVDGEAITQEELAFYIGRSRALVADRFHKQYGADVTAGFWTQDFGGETPRQALLDEAVSALRYDRAVLTDCRERGLADDISFGTFLKNLDKENDRRAKALAAGEVIYGNQAYTREAYFDYVLSNLQIKQREAMEAEGLLKPDDVDLIPFYKEIRDDYAYFRKGDGYLDYGSAKEKVAYLYKEKAYDDYIRARMEKQTVRFDDEAMAGLAIA
ncbi:MAG: hypothetical protein HP041_09070 [Oscillospiraceae bacterium]|nr:hypothetical protein [Oscillospiraceae bacterium]